MPVITIEIPEQIHSEFIQNHIDINRRIIEALAIDGYRSGELSPYQVGLILGIDDRSEVEDFLASRGVEMNYGIEDFRQDLATTAQLESKRRKDL
jgi:predicted HTH domain antitoxin